jgi:hypothetical protein
MRVNRHYLILAAAAVWLGASVTMKIARYSVAPESRQIRTERALDGFMAGIGWQRDGVLRITSDGRYLAQTYRRPGCATTMSAAVLGRGSESLEAVRDVMGKDIAFVEEGDVAAEPKSHALTLHIMLASALQVVGGPRERIPGILAVAPAPREVAPACGAPARAQWTGFRRLPD